jgi:hypothetical protein
MKLKFWQRDEDPIDNAIRALEFVPLQNGDLVVAIPKSEVAFKTLSALEDAGMVSAPKGGKIQFVVTDVKLAEAVVASGAFKAAFDDRVAKGKISRSWSCSLLPGEEPFPPLPDANPPSAEDGRSAKDRKARGDGADGRPKD